MKRKFLSIVLAVCMVLTMIPAAFAEEPGDTDESQTSAETTESGNTGYKNETLPEGPSVNGDVWTVNPQNAQYTLDGAYGSIDGKTICFGSGNYGEDALVLGRPTKYPGSNTIYYNMTWTQGTEWVRDQNSVALNELTSNIKTYTRAVKNVTLTADDNVVLPGFTATTGHKYSSGTVNEYDYVMDCAINNTNNSYHNDFQLEGITFQGLTISGKVYIETQYSGTDTVVKDFVFDNCTFTGDTSKMETTGYQAIALKTGISANKYDNVVVKNCTIKNYHQGIYTQGAVDLTIQNNSIENTTHNAIAIQPSNESDVTGTILIKENYISGANDRAVRIGNIAGETEIILNNNIMVNSGDEEGQLLKTGTVAEDASVTVNLDNNYWDGKEVAAAIGVSGPITEDNLPTSTGVISGTFPVDITDYVASGYTFVTSTDENGNMVYSPALSTPAPTPDPTPVYPSYDDDDEPTYSVTAPKADHGTVKVTPSNAYEGSRVTITATPDAGYEVDKVTVTDRKGNEITIKAAGDNKYTFVMPAGKVDVEVTFVKEYVAPSISFTDVKSNAWYYDAALYAAENGLMSGTGNGAFSPDLTTSRAMIWTILARVDGQNISVTYGNWYDKAQAWAMAAGVSDGTNPDSAITREQLAVMLYGFAKEQGYTTANGVSLSRYVDASDVSAWAVEALEWAVGNGLISSMGNNILAPTGTATRAQVAVILMNFCENIAK